MNRRGIRLLLLVSPAMVLASMSFTPVDASEEPKQPRLVCPESTFDFGRQPSTNTVYHSFTIKNEGDAPLAILKVRTSCGSCTVNHLAATNVPPGQATELQVEYRLAGSQGEKKNSIYIHTNDPRNKIYQFQIQGTVIPIEASRTAESPASKRTVPPPRSTPSGFRFDPGAISFGVVTNHAAAQRTLLVTSSTGKAFQVISAGSDLPGLDASVETLEDDGKYAVHVRVKPFAPAGELNGEIRITVNDYRLRDLNIPVSGWVIEDLVVVPQELHLDSRAREGRQDLSIFSRSRTEFKIERAEFPGNKGKVEVLKLADNGGYQIKLTHGPIGAIPEGAALTIKTDIRGKAEIKIPIHSSETGKGAHPQGGEK